MSADEGHRRDAARTITRYAVLVALAAVVLLPVYILVVNSLLRPVDISRGITWFPTAPKWDNYSTAWSDGHLSRYVLNSAIVSTAITAGQVITAILAAYAFAFLTFPLRRVLFVMFLATLMIPGEVT